MALAAAAKKCPRSWYERGCFFWPTSRRYASWARPVASSVYSRTLQKASELMGGHLKLCRYLRVPSDELANWINDPKNPLIVSCSHY